MINQTSAKNMFALASGETTRPFLISQLSRMIFVGGSPRSGTTLAQRMLDFHPAIYGGPEFDFVPPIVNLFQEMRRAVQSGRIDAFLNDKDLVDAFRTLLVSLFAPKFEAEGIHYLSEKTPSNVLAFAWLDECVPEAKKILVIRDPRDVVNSMLEVGQRQRQRRGRADGFVRDTVAAVDYMNYCLKEGMAFAKTSSNCLVIYYEDMVSSPLNTANQMYRFIGVHELDQLHLEKEPFKAARNEESWADWATPGTISGGVNKDRVGIAAHRLKSSDLDYIYAKTIRNPLLTQRYSIPPQHWTALARWCQIRCMASRVRDGLPSFWDFIRQRLTG